MFICPHFSFDLDGTFWTPADLKKSWETLESDSFYFG